MSLIFVASPAIRRQASFYLTRGVLVGDLACYQPVASVKASSSTSLFSFFSTKKILSGFSNLVIILAIAVAGALLVPALVFAVYQPEPISIVGPTAATALGGDLAQGPTHSAYVPPFNANLPTGAWLEIPVIGVRTNLVATVDPAEALDQGVWLDPNFAPPGQGQTTVLAAHRYGWKWWWKDDYWRYNSFYLLPDTQPGDLIEITYEQRKYVYEIYAATEATEITDFGADLILYTCKYLNSPQKHFRYARLLDPTVDSQSR